MSVTVRFARESIELTLTDAQLVAVDGEVSVPPIADVSRAVEAAIATPIEFPPLRQAVVPGDHVALVLDDGMPRPGDVLGPVVECLREAGAEAHDIQVIAVPAFSESPNSFSADALPPGIKLVQHDPSDNVGLSYLAARKDGTRVYLNRAVVDADLVVLVGPVDYDPIMRYRGTSSAVYPGLADDAARRALRARVHKPATRQAQADARRESDEISWLLGVQFAVAVVAGRSSDVVAVLAGACEHVQREAQRRLEQNWRRRARRRADLVIAAISGDTNGQGFDELGRALDGARGLVAEGGRIVVLSAINAQPGPSLELFRSFEDPAGVLEHLRKLAADDLISTHQIARACEHARVCLLSRLDDGLVEELGMTPIGSAAELQRLVDRAACCTILNDAQFVHATLEGEDEYSPQ